MDPKILPFFGYVVNLALDLGLQIVSEMLNTAPIVVGVFLTKVPVWCIKIEMALKLNFSQYIVLW